MPESALFRSDDGGRTWSHLGNPAGGFLAGLVVDPSDSQHLLLGARDHGGYESYDAARSGSALPGRPHTQPQSLAHPPETHTRCVEAAAWTYASTDGGQSWTRSISSEPYLLSRPGPTFYAANGAGLAVSTDCVNWTFEGDRSAYVAN